LRLELLDFPVKLLRGAAVARLPDEEACPVPKLTRRAVTTTMARAAQQTQHPAGIYYCSEIVGIITLGRKQVQPFTDKHISLFRDFAAQATIAFRRVGAGRTRCRHPDIRFTPLREGNGDQNV
jgi:hypothetical protein